MAQGRDSILTNLEEALDSWHHATQSTSTTSLITKLSSTIPLKEEAEDKSPLPPEEQKNTAILSPKNLLNTLGIAPLQLNYGESAVEYLNNLLFQKKTFLGETAIKEIYHFTQDKEDNWICSIIYRKKVFASAEHINKLAAQELAAKKVLTAIQVHSSIISYFQMGSPTATLLHLLEFRSVYRNGDELQPKIRPLIDDEGKEVFEYTLLFRDEVLASAKGETKCRAREAAALDIIKQLYNALQNVSLEDTMELTNKYNPSSRFSATQFEEDCAITPAR